MDSKVSRVAWLNRTTILYAGADKWSLDPRVVRMDNTPVTEYSIKIQNVNVHDEGPYVCSILTSNKPKSSKVHLIVQGTALLLLSDSVRLHSSLVVCDESFVNFPSRRIGLNRYHCLCLVV